MTMRRWRHRRVAPLFLPPKANGERHSDVEEVISSAVYDGDDDNNDDNGDDIVRKGDDGQDIEECQPR